MDEFKYLRSVLQNNGDIDAFTHNIRAGWVIKWRHVEWVLCDKRVSVKLKGKCYRTVVRPALLYRSKCWPVESNTHGCPERTGLGISASGASRSGRYVKVKMREYWHGGLAWLRDDAW